MIISTVASAPMDFDPVICIENYLKANNLIGKEFGNDEGISSNCNFYIPLIKKEIYHHLESELIKDGEVSKETASCIVENLSDKKFANIVLASSIYQETTKISEEKKKGLLNEIEKKMNKNILVAMFHCKVEDGFGDILIQKSNLTSEDDFSPEELFCMRKYVVEKKLIDSSYKLDSNPSKIDTRMIDCEEFNPAIRQTIEDFLKDMILDENSSEEQEDDLNSCVLRAIADENIIEYAMVVRVMQEIELTEEQEKVEKERINQIVVNFMKVLTLTCFF